MYVLGFAFLLSDAISIELTPRHHDRHWSIPTIHTSHQQQIGPRLCPKLERTLFIYPLPSSALLLQQCVTLVGTPRMKKGGTIAILIEPVGCQARKELV